MYVCFLLLEIKEPALLSAENYTVVFESQNVSIADSMLQRITFRNGENTFSLRIK